MGGENKHHIVYKTTNLINGKIYIGVHSTNKIEDGYLGSGCIFKKALNKYGRKNFLREVLFDFDNSEEAYAKEKELVNIDFINKGYNYNCKVGGEQGFYSDDSKINRMTLGDNHYRKVSMSRIGKQNFEIRIQDIKQSDKSLGWIVKLSKKWGINKAAARSFIKRWYKEFKHYEAPQTLFCCDCGEEIIRRNKKKRCLSCHNLSQRTSDLYSLSKEELQILVNNLSMFQIRKKYHLNDRNLHKVLALNEINIPDRTKHKKQIFQYLNLEEVQKLAKENSIMGLSKMFGVSRGVIKRNLRDLGIIT